jgi:hypothetical protein
MQFYWNEFDIYILVCGVLHSHMNVIIIFFLFAISDAQRIMQLRNSDPDITPMPRSNVALAPDPLDINSCYLFGGNYLNYAAQNNTFYDDLWKFTLDYSGSSNYTWEEVLHVGELPSTRSFACLSGIQLQQYASTPLLALFGGSTFNLNSGTNTPKSDHFYIYNTFTGVWANLTSDALGDGLTPRTGAACATVLSKLFVYGGVDGSGTILNEMWVYDLTNNIFVQKGSPSAPARWLASMSPISTFRSVSVIVHGGVTKYPLIVNLNLNITQSDILGDTLEFNTYYDNWTIVSTSDNVFPKRIGSVVSSSSVTNKIYQFGGDILNSTNFNTSVPHFDPTNFNISYTDCPSNQIGYTVGQMWTYSNDVRFWRNVTMTAIGANLNTNYVTPVANGAMAFLGSSVYIFGGIIVQCPFVNVINNVDVSRISL